MFASFFSKLSGSRLRARRPKPAACVALAVFSSALFVLGTSVYFALLPSFAASAMSSDAVTAESQVSAASVLGLESDGAAGGGQTPEGASDAQSAADSLDESSGTATSVETGTVLASASSVASVSPTVPEKKTSQDNSSASVNSSNSASGTKANSGHGTSKGNTSNSDANNSNATPEPDNSVKIAEYRNYLVDKVNTVNSLASTVNGLTNQFNSTAFAGTSDERYSGSYACSSAAGSCQMQINDLLVSSAPTSEFSAARDGLVGMFRSLRDYCFVLQEAFLRSAKYSDPSAHYDSVMEPLNSTYDSAAGRNKYLAEYDRWAAQVVL